MVDSAFVLLLPLELCLTPALTILLHFRALGGVMASRRELIFSLVAWIIQLLVLAWYVVMTITGFRG